MTLLPTAQLVAVVIFCFSVSLQNPHPHDARWNLSDHSSDEVSHQQRSVSNENHTIGEDSDEERSNGSLFAIAKKSSNGSLEEGNPFNDDRQIGNSLPGNSRMAGQNRGIHPINPTSNGNFSKSERNNGILQNGNVSVSERNNGSLQQQNMQINGSHEWKSKRDPFGTGAAALNGCPKLAAGLLTHGCWCGEGHRCEAIQDNVDACCHNHDQCYGFLPDQQAYCDSMFFGCLQKLNECHQ